MKGVILAAGEGSRLRPLTFGIPKPLLPIKGVPVINYALNNLRGVPDLDEVYVAVANNTGGESITNYLKEINYKFPIKTIVTDQQETGGDLRRVIEEGDISDQSVVCYADIVADIPTRELVEYHNYCQDAMATIATLCLYKVPKRDIPRVGMAYLKEFDGVTLIDRFVEKPEESKSRWGSTGYYVIDTLKFLRQLPSTKAKVEHYTFPTLCENRELAGFKGNLPLRTDIGTYESYKRAQKISDKLIPPVME